MLKKIEYFLPTLLECWIIVFYLIVLGGIISGVIIYPLEAIFHIKLGSQLPILTYLLPMIAPAIYIYHKGRNALQENSQALAIPLDKGNLGKINPPIFALSSTLVIATIAILTDPLTSIMPMPDYIKEMFKELMQLSVLSIFTVVIVAPLVEEVLLRGIMARGLFSHNTPIKAIVWSAFFFAVIHLNPWQSIPAFLSGLFLGWVYWRTHSLWACIFIHFANNGIAMLGVVLFPDMEVDLSLQQMLAPLGEHLFFTVYILSIFILLGVLYYFNKNLPAPGFMWKQDKKSAVEHE